MAPGKGLSIRIFNFLHLPTMVALILAITGGVKSFTSASANGNNGQTKAAILIFLGVLIVQSLVALLTCLKLGHVMRDERKLVFAVGASVPFLFVRIIYSLIAIFNGRSRNFSVTANTYAAVVVQACMSVIEEFVVVVLYLLAGILTPVISRSQVQRGYRQQQLHCPKDNRFPESHPMVCSQENGVKDSQAPEPQIFEPYRPR
jgi:hypothetical protein